MSGFQRFSSCQHFFINAKITVRITFSTFPVPDHHIRINDISLRNHSFMNCPIPSEISGCFHYPLPKIRKCCSPALVKPCRIFHHYNICSGIQSFFKTLQFFQIFFIQDIIRIQPHPVIGADFFQKKITRSRKIVTPGKIIHQRRILLRNLFCSV